MKTTPKKDFLNPNAESFMHTPVFLNENED